MPVDFNGDGRNEIFCYTKEVLGGVPSERANAAVMLSGPGKFELRTAWQGKRNGQARHVPGAEAGVTWLLTAQDQFHRVDLGKKRQGVFVLGRGGQTCLIRMVDKKIRMTWMGKSRRRKAASTAGSKDRRGA